MPFAEDLLEQANDLAFKEMSNPKQASLRRAVSTAYYALFHLLINEAVSKWSIERHLVCLIPLGSVYWEDEMPDLKELARVSQDDQAEMFRLFGIRLQLWDAEPLALADQKFWDAARCQVPDWALFRRLVLSPEDRVAREEVERSVEKEFQGFFREAKRVQVSDRSFSATFDVPNRED